MPIDVSAFDQDWQRIRMAEGRFHIFEDIPTMRDSTENTCSLALEYGWSLDWHLGAIDLLSRSHDRVTKARARLTPILRLDTDILAIIFELLARYEAPRKSSLGWIRLSHVCNAWRQVLLGLSNLWARDAYTYGANIAARYLLARAGDAPISVSAMRPAIGINDKPRFHERRAVVLQNKEDFDHIWAMSDTDRLLDLSVVCDDHYDGDEDSPIHVLERILSHRVQPSLRTISVWLKWAEGILPRARGSYPITLHPNLRHVEFVDMFIPFALANLVSLHVACSLPGSCMPQPWLDAMIDSLESSPALKDLRVTGWLLPQPLRSRRVNLPQLNTLACADSRLYDFLDLPALEHVHMAWMGDRDDRAQVSIVLHALFQRYGLSPRSMRLSERFCVRPLSAEPEHILVIRFGYEPSSCPPPLPLQLGNMIELMFGEEPGPFVSLALPVRGGFSERVLSLLFTEYSETVRLALGTEAIETIGFDNETLECTFERCEGVIPILSDEQLGESFSDLVLPYFPAVRKLELTLRDNDSVHHQLFSHATEGGMRCLPLLSCIRFSGSLRAAQTFMEIYPALANLLSSRARAVSAGLSPIMTLEFQLSVGSEAALLEAAEEGGAEPLKQALLKAVHVGLGDQATVTILHESSIVGPQPGFPEHRLLATIVYYT